MLKTSLRNLALLLIMLVSALVEEPAAARADSKAEVASGVWADTASGEPADFLVVLRERADLAAATARAPRPGLGVFASLRSTASTSQAALLSELEARRIPHRAYWVANVIKVRGDRTLVEWLASHSEVQYIESDRAFKVDLESPDPQFPLLIESNLSQVNAQALWQLGITGQNIVYANAKAEAV